MEEIGQGMWYLLHMYPVYLRMQKVQDEQTRMCKLYECIQAVMPCNSCKLHMIQYNLRNSVHVNENLSTWVGVLHNEVNSRLKKKELTYSQSYRWCLKCITGGWQKDFCLEFSRRVWRGIEFTLAGILLTARDMSSKLKLSLMMDIMELCKHTFPHLPTREAFTNAAEEIKLLSLSSDGLNMESCKSSVVALTRRVYRTLKLDLNRDDLTIESMLVTNGVTSTKALCGGGVQESEASNGSCAYTFNSTQSAISGGKRRRYPVSSMETSTSGEIKNATDHFDRMLPLLSGKPLNMEEELNAGFYDRPVDDSGRILKQNLWIPSDTKVKPFYVKEVQARHKPKKVSWTERR